MTEHVIPVSPLVQDYLKAIWQATEWGGPPATTSSLADRFQTSRANVSETLGRLADAGHLTREPYRPPVLTAQGEALALAMVRRHRLIETYLVSALGYDCTEVDADAERLEHAASDTFIDRIDALLGYPTADPHGDPIPSATGEVTYPAGAVRAAEASPGGYRVVRVSDAASDVLAELHAGRIHPGTRVVIDGDGGIARADGASAVPSRAGVAIWVTPL